MLRHSLLRTDVVVDYFSRSGSRMCKSRLVAISVKQKSICVYLVNIFCVVGGNLTSRSFSQCSRENDSALTENKIYNWQLGAGGESQPRAHIITSVYNITNAKQRSIVYSCTIVRKQKANARRYFVPTQHWLGHIFCSIYWRITYAFEVLFGGRSPPTLCSPKRNIVLMIKSF